MCAYLIRILIESFLIIIFIIKLYFKLRAIFNEYIRLVYTNLAYIIFSAQEISYISYSCKPREKSSLNKLKYILNNYLFFKLI
jgi:hypothetical protein